MSSGMTVSSRVKQEQRKYARRILKLATPDEVVEEYRLVAFSSSNWWRHAWVNGAILLGFTNPLGEDMEAMARGSDQEQELEMARARQRIHLANQEQGG